MTGDDLRAMSAAATPGPWAVPGLTMWLTSGLKADAELIVWLRNHADALADLIDAARNVAADVDPAVTGNALRDALDALDWEAPT